MSEIPKPWRLWRKVLTKPREQAPDPADMGTAFGLDYCLSQSDGDECAVPDAAQACPDRPFGWPLLPQR